VVLLDTEGQSGANIAVPDGAFVSGRVALTGANAITAHGKVTYSVYSDSVCTNEVAGAGTRSVYGVDSRRVRLTPGVYYWRASFAGDATDEPSVSPCGTAVETVEGQPLPSSCTGIDGRVHFDSEEGPLLVHEDLSMDLGAKQRFNAWGPGARRLRLTRLLGGWCVTRPRFSFFRGMGEAKINGVGGFLVHFWISVSQYGEATLRLHVRNASHELVFGEAGTAVPGGQLLH
jgi:hypothetical protein